MTHSRSWWSRPPGIVVLVLVGAALVYGVIELRDATMAAHVPVAADSRMEVVLDAAAQPGESGQGLVDLTRAKVLLCTTETRSADPVTALEPLEPIDGDHGRFRVVLQPALDASDQTQFRGCLRDWNLDHVRVHVRSFTTLPPAPAPSQGIAG